MKPFNPIRAWFKLSLYLFLSLLFVFKASLTFADYDPRTLKTPFYDPSDIGSCNVFMNLSSTLPDTVPEPHKSLFTQAAAKYNVNPQFITALFLSEHSNEWQSFDTKWASSPVGASGPFQFTPATWSAYKVDGDNDGVTDVNNIFDAAYAAANLISTNTDINTPLGNLDKPFTPNTILYSAAAYNWGGGNLQTKTTPDSPITVAPKETQNYLTNVYLLISSGFTKGAQALGDPTTPTQTATPTTGSTTNTNNCGGAIKGNFAQTIVSYAWPDYHPANYFEMKPEYQAAINAAQVAGKYVGGGTRPGIDCGGFVTRVMQDSGIDPNYNELKGRTSAQRQYMLDHPESYEQIRPTSTADLQPGDIAVNSVHTYLYVGTISGFNSTVASASYGGTSGTGWRTPMAGREKPADSSYDWFRHR